MRSIGKLLALSAMAAMFAWSAASYGMGRVLVFKGTIKASKTIFDVNDTNNLLSTSLQGYWVVEIAPEDTDFPATYKRGEVMNSSAVVYSTRDKNYTVIADSISFDPCDPCGVTLLEFNATGADGEAWFDAVGKGKLTKYTNTSDTTKDYVTTKMTGSGFISNYTFFNPSNTYKGPITVSLTLDSRRTRAANTDSTSVDTVVDEIVTELTRKGGWTGWL